MLLLEKEHGENCRLLPISKIRHTGVQTHDGAFLQNGAWSQKKQEMQGQYMEHLFPFFLSQGCLKYPRHRKTEKAMLFLVKQTRTNY